MMGFGKSGLFLLVLLFQLHLLSTHTIIPQENPVVTDTDRQQNVHPIFQEKAAVSRRGGVGGGHASGGGHGGSGGHGGTETAHSNGHGDTSPHTQGGGSVIPLYAAGAAGAAGGAQNHRNDHHHHGSNDASLGRSGLNYLLCTILVSLVFVHFM